MNAQTQIPDLTAWLTKIASMAFGYKTAVMDYQIHSDPVSAVEFHEGTSIVVSTLEAPAKLIPILQKKRSSVLGKLRLNPLFRVGRRTPGFELSMLNAGAMFDLELPVAWNILTAQLTEAGTLWAYILS